MPSSKGKACVSRDAELYLEDIREAAARIIRYVEGMDRSAAPVSPGSTGGTSHGCGTSSRTITSFRGLLPAQVLAETYSTLTAAPGVRIRPKAANSLIRRTWRAVRPTSIFG